MFRGYIPTYHGERTLCREAASKNIPLIPSCNLIKNEQFGMLSSDDSIPCKGKKKKNVDLQ